MVAIHCDQGNSGAGSKFSTRQKVIPERRSIWGDLEDHSCFMYISREKGGTLEDSGQCFGCCHWWTEQSFGWHGAWRWVVIFSYFHLGLVDGEILAEKGEGYEEMYNRQLCRMQIRYAM
ncbi:hypothetical protein V8C37DRAFT_369266, partial [Trichoderma ceciliae]